MKTQNEFAFNQYSDKELVTIFQEEHNSQAFSELYKRYFPKVERYCLKSFGDMQIAEDATQDVFLKVFEKLPMLKNPQLWVAWLFSITRNVVLNMHKRNSRFCLDDLSELKGVAYDDSEVEILEEKERKLTALPELLSTPKARILKLKYVEGMTIEQISHDMHLKESAVKMRLLRARNYVADMYQEAYQQRA